MDRRRRASHRRYPYSTEHRSPGFKRTCSAWRNSIRSREDMDSRSSSRNSSTHLDWKHAIHFDCVASKLMEAFFSLARLIYSKQNGKTRHQETNTCILSKERLNRRLLGLADYSSATVGSLKTDYMPSVAESESS